MGATCSRGDGAGVASPRRVSSPSSPKDAEQFDGNNNRRTSTERDVKTRHVASRRVPNPMEGSAEYRRHHRRSSNSPSNRSESSSSDEGRDESKGWLAVGGGSATGGSVPPKPAKIDTNSCSLFQPDPMAIEDTNSDATSSTTTDEKNGSSSGGMTGTVGSSRHASGRRTYSSGTGNAGSLNQLSIHLSGSTPTNSAASPTATLRDSKMVSLGSLSIPVDSAGSSLNRTNGPAIQEHLPPLFINNDANSGMASPRRKQSDTSSSQNNAPQVATTYYSPKVGLPPSSGKKNPQPFFDDLQSDADTSSSGDDEGKCAANSTPTSDSSKNRSELLSPLTSQQVVQLMEQHQQDGCASNSSTTVASGLASIYGLAKESAQSVTTQSNSVVADTRPNMASRSIERSASLSTDTLKRLRVQDKKKMDFDVLSDDTNDGSDGGVDDDDDIVCNNMVL